VPPFSGFEAMDVVPPVPGVQDSYVIVFRFDSFAHLDAWLRSDARQAILARGEGLFTSEARPQVVAGTRPAPRGAGIVVSTRVKPGRETECREWQSRIDTEAARFPGFLGNQVFAPAPGVQEEWVVVVRFDSSEHLQSWFLSDARQRLVDRAARLWDEARVERFGGGFPGWFAPGTTASGQPAFPPVWKQAMIVLLALYPTVMLLTLFLSPWLAGLPGGGDVDEQPGQGGHPHLAAHATDESPLRLLTRPLPLALPAARGAGDRCGHPRLRRLSGHLSGRALSMGAPIGSHPSVAPVSG
jgi:uncharacterized protein